MCPKNYKTVVYKTMLCDCVFARISSSVLYVLSPELFSLDWITTFTLSFCRERTKKWKQQFFLVYNFFVSVISVHRRQSIINCDLHRKVREEIEVPGQ